VPSDYFSIMSNSQQDMTLRGILVGSITQFSRDVICTSMLDTLITNHENQTIVPILKKNMTSALLFERQKLFQALFKSSIGGSQEKPMEMMRGELTKLIEENIMLKHKNISALKSLKTALSKMKERDDIILTLRSENSQLDKRLRSASSPISMPNPPSSPAQVFTDIVRRETGIVAECVVDQTINYDRPSSIGDGHVVDYNIPPIDIEHAEEHSISSYVTDNAVDNVYEKQIESHVSERPDGTSELVPGNSSTVSLDMASFLDS
jgi:uncharacterized protein YqgQ